MTADTPESWAESVGDAPPLSSLQRWYCDRFEYLAKRVGELPEGTDKSAALRALAWAKLHAVAAAGRVT